MPSIDASYTWAVTCCNLPNVGYNQDYRNQQTVNGITYYDCSSFINYALLAGGWSTPGYAPSNNAFTTGDMYSVLPELGFINVGVSGEVRPGDIGLSAVHTEMCYQGGVGFGSGIFMGAHGRNGILLPNQVSIGSSSGDTTAHWQGYTSLWRYGNGASGEVGYNWIVGTDSQYFSDFGTEQKNNAACIYSYFYFKGWTIQAIAGLCGNIMGESTFNPALLEQGVPYPTEGKGTGLVQWTPYPDRYHQLNPLHEIFNKLGYDWNEYSNGNYQCDAIYAEYQQSTGEKDWGIEGQWIPASSYPMDWKTWAHSQQDPGYLAMAFQANYERPGSIHPEREQYGREWYEYLKTVDPKFPGYDTHKPIKSKMPVWMKIRYDL